MKDLLKSLGLDFLATPIWAKIWDTILGQANGHVEKKKEIGEHRSEFYLVDLQEIDTVAAANITAWLDGLQTIGREDEAVEVIVNARGHMQEPRERTLYLAWLTDLGHMTDAERNRTILRLRNDWLQQTAQRFGLTDANLMTLADDLGLVR